MGLAPATIAIQETPALIGGMTRALILTTGAITTTLFTRGRTGTG